MKKFIAGTFAALALLGFAAPIAQAADVGGDHATTTIDSYGKA
jgi:hypothetical protein